MSKSAIALILLGFSATAHADKAYTACVESWPAAKTSSKAETNTCSRYFAREADIGGDAMWKIQASQIATLIQRLDACPDCDVVGDAKAWLARAAKGHFDFTDPVTNKSIEPLVEKMLAGQKIAAADLKDLSSVSLWKLRNAPYARHGRAFKTPDLQTFYYGDRGKDAPATKLLPRTLDPKFKDSMLDKNDDANVSLVVAEIKKRGEN